MALESTHLMRIEIKRLTLSQEQNRLFHLAKAGTVKAVALIDEGREEALEDKESLLEDSNNNIIGRYRVKVVDEAGKLNINTATYEMLERLFENIPEMNAKSVAQAVINYRGSKESKSFDTTKEVLLVKGMTASIFYKEDTNDNNRLDPWEDDGERSLPDDNKDGKLDLGLKALITAFSQGKVNINSASAEVLQSLPMVTSEIARTIMEQRRSRPFASIEELKSFS